MTVIGLADMTWLSHVLDRPDSIAVLCGCSVGVIALVVNAWRRIEAHRADVELKRDMVTRGLSVEEIERVLVAKTPK